MVARSGRLQGCCPCSVLIWHSTVMMPATPCSVGWFRFVWSSREDPPPPGVPWSVWLCALGRAAAAETRAPAARVLRGLAGLSSEPSVRAVLCARGPASGGQHAQHGAATRCNAAELSKQQATPAEQEAAQGVLAIPRLSPPRSACRPLGRLVPTPPRPPQTPLPRPLAPSRAEELLPLLLPLPSWDPRGSALQQQGSATQTPRGATTQASRRSLEPGRPLASRRRAPSHTWHATSGARAPRDATARHSTRGTPGSSARSVPFPRGSTSHLVGRGEGVLPLPIPLPPG